jgi:hypothetical protein
MLNRVTTFEEDEFRILALMTAETRKFVAPLGMAFAQEQQDALERLMLRDWIRLIDISYAPTAGPGMFRVFRVMPEAIAWYESRKATFQ